MEVTARVTAAPRAVTARRLLREAAVLAVLWVVYSVGRGLAGRHIGRAFPNSSDVWRLERRLHLPSEASLQHTVLGWHGVIHLADLYYEYVHFSDFLLVTAWLLLRHPEHFRWFRRVLVFITGMELVGHFVYPLAPARMRPDLGMVDTAQLDGHSVYGHTYADHGWFNQYAAMPSMHVGWAFFVALVVISIARSPWRWLVIAHPALMTLTVVVTGNHYWLDGIVGVALLAIGLVVFRRDAPWNRPANRVAACLPTSR
jgi:hypothetical protein